MRRLAVLPRLQELTQDQWGMVTRRQLESRGIGKSTLERMIAPNSGVLERVTTGVYRFKAAPIPDHLELRAAWLQLAPDSPAWTRQPDQGVVSHRSAAAMYGLGHLTADIHEFTLPRRKQTRRKDVRLHARDLEVTEWIKLQGLFVTRPSRIVSDLLRDNEDPEAVAQIIVNAIQLTFDYPGIVADQLAPHAARFGLRNSDGIGLLGWLLELTGESNTGHWITEARKHEKDKTSLNGGAE